MATADVFSKRLKELCDTAPSVSAVARDLGINRQQFARYLNGSTLPRPNVVQQIADYFKIDPSRLYRSRSLDQPAGDPVLAALSTMVQGALLEPILDHELQPGFYLQYKQLFSMPGSILLTLAHIRKENGAHHYKRRTSAKIVRHLPGAQVRYSNEGVFFKQGGVLVLIDVGALTKDMTYHAFRTGAAFDPHVKPGLHMTPGRQGSVGPRAARIVLHRLPEGVSPLKAAREQRVMKLSEVPDVIRIHLEPTARDNQGIFGLG